MLKKLHHRKGAARDRAAGLKMNIKQILVSTGIAFAFIAVLIATILVIDTIKPNRGKIANMAVAPDTADDMIDHHAPPAPADNTKFNSLIGQAAPEFNLKSYDGKNINLTELKGKNVVLFFSEGAMCYPSCWDQINAFTKDKGFAKKDTAVFTIVVDPKSEWDGVVRQDPKIAEAVVLFDTDRKVSADYGVLTVDSSMHRGQFPGHTYVIIDKEGIVRYELDDVRMEINNGKLLADIGKL